MNIRHVFGALVAVAGFFFSQYSLHAQVLLWSTLPDDGTWVRFEGSYTDEQKRADETLKLTWRRELTIKSVGRETVEIDGKPTPCRWLEFKTVTGKESEQGIQPDPFGTRIYKVLVPEAKVTGRLVDGDNIPVIFLPIVRGYRKIGDRPPVPISEKVLSFSPMITLLTYYPNLEAAGAEEELSLPLGAVPAQVRKGSVVQESNINRSTNEGTLWLSKEVPFGLAKFQVKVVREQKDGPAPRDDFMPVVELNAELTAVAKGTDARSELPDLK
jgi:hypothetical protein